MLTESQSQAMSFGILVKYSVEGMAHRSIPVLAPVTDGLEHAALDADVTCVDLVA